MPTAFDEELLRYAEQLKFGDIHFKLDPKTGLHAIIAIHSTKLGPALGGCRFITYPTLGDGIRDVLRLAFGMSYKAAMANLPLGGGKAVILKPQTPFDRVAYFEAFGRFVNELGGRYITAMDSGSEMSDMDVIARTTSYVTNTSKHDGDPAPYTAQGVFRGIEAAIYFRTGQRDLKNLKVAIQGVGHVGFLLAKLLHEAGAKLIVCDSNPARALRCAEMFGAEVIAPEVIHKVSCDIFSPCALGATLNTKTIPEIQAKFVVGSANNQLADTHCGTLLQQRGILYAPDYVTNAGGLIFAYALYKNTPLENATQHIDGIYETLLEVFKRAAKEHTATHLIADSIAAERL